MVEITREFYDFLAGVDSKSRGEDSLRRVATVLMVRLSCLYVYGHICLIHHVVFTVRKMTFLTRWI